MAGRVHLAVSGRGKWFPQCASDGLVAALKLFAIHHCALLLCLLNVFALYDAECTFPLKYCLVCYLLFKFSVSYSFSHLIHCELKSSFVLSKCKYQV